MKKLFQTWLEKNNKPARYYNTISTISNDLEKINYSSSDLYLIKDISTLINIKDNYFSIPEFYEKNERGNSMYSSAFNRYIEFIDSLEENILINDLNKIINIDIRTETMNLITCRLGQGLFRDNLIKYWNKCPITGVSNSDLLVASHIKPWSLSNDLERLDVFNGILLSPNMDKLFDKGYISFENTGCIILSEKLIEYKKLGLNDSIKITFDTNHYKYLKFHRKNIFRKG